MELESADRKFLHDLATPLTIAKTLVKKQVEELGSLQLSPESKVLERMQKILKALLEIERLHADQKIIITARYG